MSSSPTLQSECQTIRAIEHIDPILARNVDRFVLAVQRHQDLFDMYKTHLAAFWTPSEVDMTQDRGDFERLSRPEQEFIETVLAFFASADGIVAENVAARLAVEVQLPEARAFYAVQHLMETVHSETYINLIRALIPDDEKQRALFAADRVNAAIQDKAAFALHYMDGDERSACFAKRLVAFACVEGIFFSSAFCSIFWLKKRGICHGIGLANELISRDEALHTDFACLLYSKLQMKLSTKAVHAIVRKAVEIEVEFVQHALPVSLIGINSDLMSEYVRCVADRLLVSLGYPTIYNVTNPFEWMNMISVRGKTNFFEKRVSDYQLPGEKTSKKINYDETE